MILTDFGGLIAERLRASHLKLAARWLERLIALVPVDAEDVFPDETLLDHIPDLILEIAAYVEMPEEQAIAANAVILEKAKQLGALRYSQRASLHQVLREYQILDGVLLHFLLEEMQMLQVVPAPADAIKLSIQVHQAVDVLSQTTVEAFVASYTQTIADQNQRLEQFTRMAAHEWRQPLGALQFGIDMLIRPDLPADVASRTLRTFQRNVEHLVGLTKKLESIARMHDAADTPTTQEVSLLTVANEAVRQLRDMAHARDVRVQVAESLPTIVVDVGRLELVLVNLIANAIKYADNDKPSRFVDISGQIGDDGWCVLRVSDNGVGIHPDDVETVFRRFTRATRDRLAHVEGSGLGLSIVEDCMSALGGSAGVTSELGVGTSFELRLPARPGEG